MAWSVYSQCELIKALLDAGANMDVPASDPVGRSVFQHAVFHGYLDIVHLLLAATWMSVSAAETTTLRR